MLLLMGRILHLVQQYLLEEEEVLERILLEAMADQEGEVVRHGPFHPALQEVPDCKGKEITVVVV
jgi:hypothetical protein